MVKNVRSVFLSLLHLGRERCWVNPKPILYKAGTKGVSQLYDMCFINDFTSENSLINLTPNLDVEEIKKGEPNIVGPNSHPSTCVQEERWSEFQSQSVLLGNLLERDEGGEGVGEAK